MNFGVGHSSMMIVSDVTLCDSLKYWILTSRLDSGQIFRKDLVGGKKLPETVTELAGGEKERFLDLASGMLHWLPEKRKTAKELLLHPFFDRKNW